jgi:hypothetical protein
MFQFVVFWWPHASAIALGSKRLSRFNNRFYFLFFLHLPYYLSMCEAEELDQLISYLLLSRSPLARRDGWGCTMDDTVEREVKREHTGARGTSDTTYSLQHVETVLSDAENRFVKSDDGVEPIDIFGSTESVKGTYNKRFKIISIPRRPYYLRKSLLQFDWSRSSQRDSS